MENQETFFGRSLSVGSLLPTSVTGTLVTSAGGVLVLSSQRGHYRERQRNDTCTRKVACC